MTRHIATTAAFLYLASVGAFAEVPKLLNYQGRVTDSTGTPIGNGTAVNRKIVFRIWDHATNSAPTNRLWTEEQTATILNGEFSVILGLGVAATGTAAGESRPALDTVFSTTSSQRFLEIMVDDGNDVIDGLDQPISPRQQITSTAFAMKAGVAEAVDATGLSTLSKFNVMQANTINVNGRNTLEFGLGEFKADPNAGKIGYQTYSNGLDIVGATDITAIGSPRKVTLWAEGGTFFNGPINVGGNISLSSGPIDLRGRHSPFVGSFNGGHSVGSQEWTTYIRTARSTAFYLGGNYSSLEKNNGGGTTMAILDANGFNLNLGRFTGDGSGLANVPLPTQVNTLGVTGSNVIEFGRGTPKGPSNGMIGYGTFSSGGALDIVGAGTRNDYLDRKINLHTQGGLNILGPTSLNGTASLYGNLLMPNNNIEFGNRTAQHLNLWGNQYGIGVQDSTQYYRSGGHFAWFVGGSHENGVTNPGAGGSTLAILNGGGLTLGVGRLSFNPSGWYLDHFGGSNFNFGLGSVYMSAISRADGSYLRYSDQSLKKDFKAITHGLADLMKLKPCSYHYKTQAEADPLSLGFIAQEVQTVMPELVNKGDNGKLALNYDGFIPVTVAAVQEQQKQIDSLKGENAALKKRLEALEAKEAARDAKVAALEQLMQKGSTPSEKRMPVLKTSSATTR